MAMVLTAQAPSARQTATSTSETAIRPETQTWPTTSDRPDGSRLRATGHRRQVSPADQRIAVWWKNRSPHIGFILALGLLLRRSHRWSKAKLNIRMVVDSETEALEYEKRLEDFVEKERLKAGTETIMREGRDVYEIIRTSSEGADLVLLGIRAPEGGETVQEYAAYYGHLLEMTDRLPPTALLMASEDIDFKRIFDSDDAL